LGLPHPSFASGRSRRDALSLVGLFTYRLRR
jgi:hypothetical protein